jgi:hypothetical protein
VTQPDGFFHFQELWDAVTHGLNWLVGVALVAAGWFLGRFQAVAGRRAEAAIERRWNLLDRWRKEQSKNKKEAKARRAEAERLARLERERVGKQFVRRVYKGDPGMVGQVVELNQRDPTRSVILTWSSPAGREPHEDDYEVGQRIGMAWKDLTMPAPDQRHRTARLIARSGDDNDGWVEFESLT